MVDVICIGCAALPVFRHVWLVAGVLCTVGGPSQQCEWRVGQVWWYTVGRIDNLLHATGLVVVPIDVLLQLQQKTWCGGCCTDRHRLWPSRQCEWQVGPALVYNVESSLFQNRGSLQTGV